jgi:hypothetical protein
MSIDTIAIVFFLVAAILAAIDLVRARGEALTSWAALLIAIALILLRVA